MNCGIISCNLKENSISTTYKMFFPEMFLVFIFLNSSLVANSYVPSLSSLFCQKKFCFHWYLVQLLFLTVTISHILPSSNIPCFLDYSVLIMFRWVNCSQYFVDTKYFLASFLESFSLKCWRWIAGSSNKLLYLAPTVLPPLLYTENLWGTLH